MMLFLELAAVVVLIFLGRALHFHLRYRFLKKVEPRFIAYHEKGSASYSDPDSRWLEEHTLKVKRYIIEAGIEEPHISFREPGGLGMVAPAAAGVLDNWLVKESEFARRVRTLLVRAIGHYRDQRWQSLNPLCWIESIVFLPKEILSSIGIEKPKWVMNLLQVLYWAATIILGIYNTKR